MNKVKYDFLIIFQTSAIYPKNISASDLHPMKFAMSNLDCI